MRVLMLMETIYIKRRKKRQLIVMDMLQIFPLKNIWKKQTIPVKKNIIIRTIEISKNLKKHKVKNMVICMYVQQNINLR